MKHDVSVLDPQSFHNPNLISMRINRPGHRKKQDGGRDQKEHQGNHPAHHAVVINGLMNLIVTE
ncbi:hypothetical protein D3C76_1565160 [compost metagenome]